MIDGDVVLISGGNERETACVKSVIKRKVVSKPTIWNHQD